MALGKTLPDTLVAIIDKNGQFPEPGIPGELALAGPHVAAGYLNNPQRTAEKFRKLEHPCYGLQTWYISGDLARQDPDGTFHFLGRTDNELKISGYRIMLEEVEHYLRQSAACHTVAIIPWHDQLGVAEALIGFVVTDEQIDEPAIKKSMGLDLPRPMVPRRIFVITELPLNPNGKIDRKALTQIADKGVSL